MEELSDNNGMFCQQYNLEELSFVSDALYKTRKRIKNAVGIFIIVAVVNIIFGSVSILRPGVLSDWGVIGGIGPLDYIVFGLIYLALSVGISRHSRRSLLTSVMVFVLDSILSIFYGDSLTGYILKAAMLFGLVTGIIGCDRYYGLKIMYREPPGNEMLQMIDSGKYGQKALQKRIITTVCLIGICVGTYGVVVMAAPVNYFGQLTYLSIFTPSLDFSEARTKIDSLDYLYDPVQVETTGGTIIRRGLTDFNIEYVAEYAIAGRVVGTQNYSSRRFGDRISPRDVAMAWGWLSDTEMDAHITWGSYVYRGFRYSVNNGRWLESVGGRVAVMSHVSNNHLIPDSNRTRKLISYIEVGDFVKIEGYLVNATAYIGRTYHFWNSDTARDNEDCEVIYVTDVTWLQGPH